MYKLQYLNRRLKWYVLLLTSVYFKSISSNCITCNIGSVQSTMLVTA